MHQQSFDVINFVCQIENWKASSFSKDVCGVKKKSYPTLPKDKYGKEKFVVRMLLIFY